MEHCPDSLMTLTAHTDQVPTAIIPHSVDSSNSKFSKVKFSLTAFELARFKNPKQGSQSCKTRLSSFSYGTD